MHKLIHFHMIEKTKREKEGVKESEEMKVENQKRQI